MRARTLRFFSLFFLAMTIEKRFKKKSFKLRLKEACEGLVYVSETDSAVEPFFGEKARSRSSADVLTAIGVPDFLHVAKIDFETFFERLTSEKDWFGDRHKINANGFKALKRLLENELTDLKVFRVGKIQIAIYVLGFDKDGKVAVVKMNAIET